MLGLNHTRLKYMFGALVAVAAGALEAGPFEISRSTINGGGVMRSAGGAYELSGTIGQPDTGRMAGAGLELNGGFWFPITPGDVNEDGLVTLVDFASFDVCMTGPAGVIDPGCEHLDFNNDGRVDIADVWLFQLGFSGQ